MKNYTNRVTIIKSNRYNKNKDIFYLDNIDFFIPKDNSVILVLPFFNKLLVNTIKKRVVNTLEELNIKKLFIITVGNNETFLLHKIEVQVLPFYEWEKIATKLKEADTEFILEPTLRFEGIAGEQHTMFFLDPFGNPIELKSFADMSQVFNA